MSIASPDDRTVVTLVVGAGGLLGKAVTRELHRRDSPARGARVRWDLDPVGDLAEELDALAGASRDRRWQVLWCAGAGVTNSSPQDFAHEEAVFAGFAAALTERCDDGGLDPSTGALFLASSAGGLYAGSPEPPFTERSPVNPLAPYGMSKLRLEETVEELARDAGLVAVIGRFTNLYGPGQDLRKPQGLVSHLCRAHVTGAPVGIYVPLDTLRDYLYVEDAASLVTDVMGRAATGVRGTCTMKILGSQHSVSVGALLGEAQRIFRRPVPVLLAASRHASLQAHDLRVRSVVWPDLDRRTFWTLPAGIAATAVDVQTRMLAGRGR